MNDLFSLHSVWMALNPNEAISKVIIWFMWLLFVVYVVYLTLYYVRVAKRRVQGLAKPLGAINAQYAESLSASSTNASLSSALFDYKQQLQQQFAQHTDPLLKQAWLSFDRSLISNRAQTQLYSTVDSRYFFNENVLAPWLSGNRLIVSVPSMLVAIGVLGTFIGLVIGLSGLDAHAEDTETLRMGIGTLISGASVAFTTSIWGVLLSLLAGVVERSYERAIKARVARLHTVLAALFPALSSEQALVYMEEHHEQSTQALLSLHERIADELERSVQDLSLQMQQAVTQSLENVMQPAIDRLVDSSQQQSSEALQQSTEALQQLLKQFMGGMNQVGQSQTREMGQASERLDGSLDKLSQITKASSEQNQQMMAQHRELTQNYEHAVASMRDSSRYLAAASTQLGGISRDLLAVSREVGLRGGFSAERIAPDAPALPEEKKGNPYAS